MGVCLAPVTAVGALGAGLVWSSGAYAQALTGLVDAAAPASPQASEGLFSSSRSTLLGDVGGLRTDLAQLGLSFGIQETDEGFDNVSGGIHRGAAYDGVTQVSLGLDTQKAFGWAGGIFNVSALQIHGRSISADNLDAIQAVSGTEADDATRLWELWFQQTLFDGKADIKIGQQAFDQEFMISQYGGLFLNSVMGSPALPAVDLYAGGPQYPLSSLGVRVRVRPTDSLTVLAAVFDDNPPGGPFSDDSALRGREASGTAFNLNTGALWMAEVQYNLSIPSSTIDNSGKRVADPLPGTYKLGFWYDSGSFADQQYDTQGLSLANPASSGNPLAHHGNYSVYAVMDQAVWQPVPQGPRSLGIFAELSIAPSDRNEVSFSATAGLNLADPLPGRDADDAGIGFGVTKISSSLAALDRSMGMPVQTNETFVEATYQMQIAGWWQLQPDIQYIIRPSGGVSDPSNPSKIVGNELVFGLHSVVTF